MEEENPKSCTQEIYDGLHEQNQQADFKGQVGFWVQGDCVFIPASIPETAIDQYRYKMDLCQIGISYNWGCAAIHNTKQRVEAQRIHDLQREDQ